MKNRTTTVTTGPKKKWKGPLVILPLPFNSGTYAEGRE